MKHFIFKPIIYYIFEMQSVMLKLQATPYNFKEARLMSRALKGAYEVPILLKMKTKVILFGLLVHLDEFQFSNLLSNTK